MRWFCAVATGQGCLRRAELRVDRKRQVAGHFLHFECARTVSGADRGFESVGNLLTLLAAP